MGESVIDELIAWQALDSRGNPTVAVLVRLDTKHEGRAMAPSGASVGSFEADERRDGLAAFGGRGVQSAVDQVRALAPILRGIPADPSHIDAQLSDLDGSERLGRIGANACVAISIAVAQAAAAEAGAELFEHLSEGDFRLPLPMINILSGGRHAGGAVDLQDYLVIPYGARTFAEAIAMSWDIRASTAALATVRGHDPALVADEGGFGIPLATNREGIELLSMAVEDVGLAVGSEVGLAIDVAANQLWDGERYQLRIENRGLDTDEMIGELAEWILDYPALVSIEDPLRDTDTNGWVALTERLGRRTQVLGDDLFCTQPNRVAEGVGSWANAVLIKPNQAGLLTKARSALRIATESGLATVVSARSGDTEERWLADLAVGWGADQIKVGSLARSERTAKWNRLLEIEARHPETTFAGRDGLRIDLPNRDASCG